MLESGSRLRTELKTIPERLVNDFRRLVPNSPYYLAVIFWILILGPGLTSLSVFLEVIYLSLSKGIIGSLTGSQLVQYTFSWVPTDPVAVAGQIVEYASLAYVFYATRYIREKILFAKKSLSMVFSYQEKEFTKFLERLCSAKVPLQLALVWAAVFGIVIPALSYGTSLLPQLIIGSAPLFVSGTIIASLVWTYYVSLRGIRRLGKNLDVVLSYSEDPFLGLKPVGSLSLHIAGAYFIYLGIGSISDAIVLLVFGQDLPSPTSVSISAGAFVLALLGLALFFVPLIGFHDRMVKEKQRETENVERKLSSALNKQGSSELDDLVELAQIPLIKERVSKIHEWPFDTQTLSKLIAFFLAIVSSVMISVIEHVLHL